MGIVASHIGISVGDTIKRVVVTLTCTAAADGSFADYTLDPAVFTRGHRTYGIKGFYLFSVETNPGAVAPTAAYDINLWNGDKSFDLAQTLLTNRSASNTEKVYLAAVGEPMFDSSWILSISNNAVNGAIIVIKLTFSID